MVRWCAMAHSNLVIVAIPRKIPVGYMGHVPGSCVRAALRSDIPSLRLISAGLFFGWITTIRKQVPFWTLIKTEPESRRGTRLSQILMFRNESMLKLWKILTHCIDRNSYGQHCTVQPQSLFSFMHLILWQIESFILMKSLYPHDHQLDLRRPDEPKPLH